MNHARVILIVLCITLPTLVLLPMPSEATYYDSQWDYRKQITLDHDQVPSNLSFFPLLIHITDTDLKSNAQSDGDDILFTDSSHNKIPHEIERFNSATGELVAWVNITHLLSHVNTTIYMYYGNPTCSNQENINETWRDEYQFVTHGNVTGFDLMDSSGNDYDADTHYGNVPDSRTNVSAFGYYQDYDGSVDRFDTQNTWNSRSGAFTVSAWVYHRDNTWDTICSDYAAPNGNHFLLETDNDGNGWIRFAIDDGAALDVYEGSTPLSGWCHVAGSSDDTGTVEVYYNGSDDGGGNDAFAGYTSNGELTVGDRSSAGKTWNGGIDEVRWYNGVLNSSWINTEYNNMNNASDGGFYTMGSELAFADIGPFIVSSTPTDEQAEVPLSLGYVNVTINEPDGDTFNWSIETSPDIGNASANNEHNGSKSCTVSGLVSGTTYTVFVNATDTDGHWMNETFVFYTYGNIEFWCYDETNPSVGIPFGLEITNSHFYVNYSMTNGDNISISSLPHGEDVVFVVNSTGYKSRLYTYTVDTNGSYNFTFYLPPDLDSNLKIKTKTVTNPALDLTFTLDCIPDVFVSVEGYNDSLYGHWFSIGEDNYTVSDTSMTIDAEVLDVNTTVVRVQYYCRDITSLYTFRVIDEYAQPVNNAKIIVSRYINTTESYENVSSFLTDGNGYVSCYLIGETFYKFEISKTGYITEYSEWVPVIEESSVPKVFLLHAVDTEGLVDLWDHIMFDFSPDAHTHYDNFTFYFNISSDDSSLEYSNLTVFVYDNSSFSWYQIYTSNDSTASGHSFSYTTVNGSGLYGMQCSFKHEEYSRYTFGQILYSKPVLVYHVYDDSGQNGSWIDDRIEQVVGPSPVFVGTTVIAYTSLGMVGIAIFMLFTFSSRFAGIAICIEALVLAVFRDVITVLDSAVLTGMVVVFLFLFGLMTHMIIKKETV